MEAVGPPRMGKVLEVLAGRLGKVRNEALVYCILAATTMAVIAYFVGSANIALQLVQALMYLASMSILLLGTWFALTQLPSSHRELEFGEQAVEIVREHEEKVADGKRP